MTIDTKSIFASKTFYFGAVQILLGLLGLITGKIDSATSISLITTGAGTIGFRLNTEAPVTLTGGLRSR